MTSCVIFSTKISSTSTIENSGHFLTLSEMMYVIEVSGILLYNQLLWWDNRVYLLISFRSWLLLNWCNEVIFIITWNQFDQGNLVVDNTEYMTLSNEEHQVTLVELVPTQDNIGYEQLPVVDNDDYI